MTYSSNNGTSNEMSVSAITSTTCKLMSFLFLKSNTLRDYVCVLCVYVCACCVCMCFVCVCDVCCVCVLCMCVVCVCVCCVWCVCVLCVCVVYVCVCDVCMCVCMCVVCVCCVCVLVCWMAHHILFLTIQGIEMISHKHFQKKICKEKKLDQFYQRTRDAYPSDVSNSVASST